MPHDSDADHHAGLARDLQILSARLDRRRLLEWAAYLGATALGCSGSAASSGSDAGTSASNLADDGSCSAIPQETEGPYPGDGTNGPNALGLSGIVRSDITSSIAGATGVAGGIPLEVRLRLMDTSCTPLPGFALYLWHCDREGRYSMYSSGAENENYLRGVQEADDDGVVTFTTIFPACYTGRWPHIHFEIYESLAAASSGQNAVKTSQLALPEEACDEVFDTSGYQASIQNLARLTLETDGIFRDGVTLQLASITGDVNSGYVATLDVAVAI
ncbi:MAG TPA: intradiol ring-cleavage dioxygenase [Polyangiaceae bacterium]|nr:intradiol ring-cleavage dioxygenase [Polyangiaceae bacterium]